MDNSGGDCLQELISSATSDAGDEDVTFNCPECRTPFSSPDDVIQPFRVFRNILQDIKIQCPHDGCQEEIEYDQYEAHTDQ